MNYFDPWGISSLICAIFPKLIDTDIEAFNWNIKNIMHIMIRVWWWWADRKGSDQNQLNFFSWKSLWSMITDHCLLLLIRKTRSPASLTSQSVDAPPAAYLPFPSHWAVLQQILSAVMWNFCAMGVIWSLQLGKIPLKWSMLKCINSTNAMCYLQTSIGHSLVSYRGTLQKKIRWSNIT